MTIDRLTPEQKEAAISSVKLGSVWAAVGVSTWADFASMLAALLSFLFICEWFWKKLIRPLCESRGWVKRKRRRKTDDELDTDRVGL